MKIFVTGGTGFVGSHFLNQAIDHDIVALRRTDRTIDLIKQPVWVTSLINAVSQRSIDGCDVLLHLAAHSANVPYDSLEACIYWNVIAPLTLFRTALKSGVKKFVVAGSFFESNPNNAYAISKAAASMAFEQFAKDNNVDLVIYKVPHTYGEGELETRLWPSLKKAALAGDDFTINCGGQFKEFAPVEEVAAKFLTLCENDTLPGLTYVGQTMSVAEFCSEWWERWGATGKLITL